jgi:hypothetical protein
MDRGKQVEIKFMLPIMQLKSQNTNSCNTRWQFTLRDMMIGVTLLCVVLAFANWLGIYGLIGSLLLIIFFVLGIAIYKRRKRLAILSCICLVTLIVGPVLYFYIGSWSFVVNACGKCGKEQIIVQIMTMNIFREEKDSNLSNWYMHIDPEHHDHQWQILYSTARTWIGSVECSDSFGFFLHPLNRLKEVSEKVDKTTFLEILSDYKALKQNQESRSSFYDRCDQIISEAKEK